MSLLLYRKYYAKLPSLYSFCNSHFAQMFCRFAKKVFISRIFLVKLSRKRNCSSVQGEDAKILMSYGQKYTFNRVKGNPKLYMFLFTDGLF